MRLFAMLIFAALLPAIASAQETQSWAATYTGFGDAPHMTTDAGGNVYIAGDNSPNSATLLLKYSPSGTVQWTASYSYSYVPSSYAQTIVGVATDPSGNTYICVNVYQTTYTGPHETITPAGVATVKFSPSGSQLWAQFTTIGGIPVSASAMTVDAAGNTYFTGNYNPGLNTDYVTVKVNTNGVQRWAVTYNGTAGNGNDLGTAIAVDAGGNVYVTGSSQGAIPIKERSGYFYLNTGFDIVTIKLDSLGNTLWNQRYNDAQNDDDYASVMTLDASGNVYVAGTTSNTGTAITLAYSSDGTPLWTDQNAASSSTAAIAVDPSGNTFTSGYTSTNSFIITKYAPGGSSLWTFLPNAGWLYDQIAMALDNQGNCYLTFTTTTPGVPNNFNIYTTLGLSSNGSLLWSETYNDYGQDNPKAIAVFTPTSRTGQFVSPTVYVSGTASSGIATVAYTSVPVSGLATMPDTLKSGANNMAALSNYPNPFRGTTTITYTLPNDSHVLLQIFDNAGRLISTPVNDNENAGPHSHTWLAGRIASGVYQYRIVAQSPQGAFTQTRQMLME